MKPIKVDSLNLVKGSTLKKLWERKVTGKEGEILADRDADGNTVLRLANRIKNSAATVVPWTVQIVGVTAGGAVIMTVQPASTLLTSEDPGDVATVTNFEAAHEVTSAQHLRLVVTTDTLGDLVTATLGVGAPPTATWTPTSPSAPDDYAGTIVQSIAYLRTPLVNEFSNVTIGAIPYVVVCPLSTNLLLDLKCLKSTGKLTPVLAPWHGGAV